jgi:hypothetical protein
MGKRELLLIAAFIIAGAIVYQVTAPPPAPGERSFSPGRFIENIRREIRGNRASADITTTSTHAVDPTVTELRVQLPSGELTIAGEDRQDLGVELQVHSTGYDDAEAQRLAKETVLQIEGAGGRLVAEAKFPQAGRQTANLMLRMPSRLQLKIEPSSARSRVANVAAVELSNSRGESEFKQIAGRVSGNYRGGELQIVDAGGLKLTTVGTDVRLEQIRGEATLNMRSGELRGSELGGPIDLDTVGTDILLEKLDKTAGILRINAVSGSVSVKGLRTEGRIDVRGADVDIVIERAAPLAIYAEGGDPIEITPPAGGYQLDAVASDGIITLPPGTLEVVTSGQEHRATGPVNGGGPTITVRSAHGNITVRSR